MPPLGVRLAFGAGGAVFAVKESAYTMFVLIFYTQVLGLSGSLTGLVLALSLIWDAISDPLVGTLSDRLNSRFGRRHPFMVASILPLGLGFIGLFSPPESVLSSQAGLAGWLLFWSLFIRTAVTTFAIPNLAQSTELTSDYFERSQVLGLRLGILFLFSVFTPALALLLIFGTGSGGEDGRFDAANYPLYGWMSAGLCWVMATITCVGTRRYAVRNVDTRGLPPVSTAARDLVRDLLRTLGNASFRHVLAYDIAMMAAYGVIAALNMLVWTYYWRFDATQVAIILSVPSLLAVVLVLLTLRPLTQRFEKSQLLQLCAVGLVLNTLWLYPLRIAGVLPEAPDGLVFALNLLFMLIFMYCFLLRGIQTQSIIADITDEHEWDHDRRQEGGFFAASLLTQKVATIIGPLYGGLALDVIGLEGSMLPGAVPQPVLDGLVVAYGLGTLPGMLIALFFGMRIALTRARVEEIQQLLRERSAQRNL